MSKYNLLINIIKHLDKFESEKNNSIDIEEFVLYLNENVLIPNKQDVEFKPDFSKKENHHPENFLDVEFATLLTSLSRFAKHYIKKAFHDRKFKTLDEFSFLATLAREDSLLKSDLINRHLMEISSGSEILKRLIKNGLLKEFPDEKDKRAKRVSLTPLGYKEITASFNEMYQVAQIVKGDLSSEEMNQAIILFKKLDFYHWGIHGHDKDTELDSLHKKYVLKKD